MIERIRVSSRKGQELQDITSQVNEALHRLGASDGICQVYVPHTTCGLVINENADPDVCTDILEWLEKVVPDAGRYRHAEGNADAHIKSTLVGQSVCIPIEGGKLALGTWQAVFLAEFDGPRQRTAIVNVVPTA